MKLNDEERRIMVSLEYEKAQSFLEQAEKIAAMDYGMSLLTDCTMQFSMLYRPF